LIGIKKVDMASPVYGTSYLEIAPPISATPPNIAEGMPLLDPAFVTAWNNTKYLIPAPWEGDKALIQGMATLAYAYKSGTGTDTPTLSSISPTTIANTTAFTLICNGTSFDAGATIVFKGVDQTTNHVNSGQVTASIGALQIPVAGNYAVAVRNANNVVSATINLVVT
jgi:hypothetical protein